MAGACACMACAGACMACAGACMAGTVACALQQTPWHTPAVCGHGVCWRLHGRCLRLHGRCHGRCFAANAMAHANGLWPWRVPPAAMAVCPSVCPSVCTRQPLSVCPSVCPSVCGSVYATPAVQISLSATYNTTKQPLDPTEAERAVPCSHNYHSCDCSHCLTPTLAPY